MDKKETEFAAKLLATFKVEAEEHVQALSNEILAFEQAKEPSEKKQLLEAIFREAHSLKGAARSVNQLTIQTICQALENVLAALKQERLQVSKEIFNVMYTTIDYIQKILSGDSNSVDKEKVSTLIQALDQFLEAQTIQAPTPEVLQEVKQPDSAKQQPVPIKEQERTIRVSEHKLDLLFQQIEEMLTLKLNAYQHNVFLKQMHAQTKIWEKKWLNVQSGIKVMHQVILADYHLGAAQKKSLHALFTFYKWQETFFSTLESGMKILLKRISQDYHLAGSTVDSIMEDTRKVLMQPCSTLFEIVPRMARDLAQATGKEVHLTFTGEQVEVDRRILEEMKDPLIHLIRNSIDHGIETPAEREKLQKPPEGTIKLSVLQTGGNTVELVISDDGRGIDIDKIKASAVKIRTLTQSEADSMSDSQSLFLIFHSGVSTSQKITDLSGRGIGMGVVQEKVDKLGGHIYVETVKGKGTTFRIILPTTLATFRGVFIKVAGREFIMPTQHLQRVLRFKKKDIKLIENQQTIVIDDQIIPILHLADLLQISSTHQQESEKNVWQVILIKYMDQSIAFIVDDVLNEQEVLLKPIGKHLSPVPNILAATISQSGTVIPILNPPDLLKTALTTHSEARPVKEPQAERKSKKTILIAEDSATIRMLLKNILEAHDYAVITTKDGVEALALFNAEQICLLISDVEMPNMDGLTLTQKIRLTNRGKTLPIILCTSLSSKEDKEKGIAAGANVYLDKKDFTETKLIDVINNLLKEPVC